MFVLVYIDDIIVVSSSPKATNALLIDLKKDFALKDLNNLHYFLCIKVKRTGDSPVLPQRRYARDILKRSGQYLTLTQPDISFVVSKVSMLACSHNSSFERHEKDLAV